MDNSLFTPQIILPAGSALIAVGAYITTVLTHGQRITKLEDKKVCDVHNELFQNIRDDLTYLRDRLDKVAENMGLPGYIPKNKRD